MSRLHRVFAGPLPPWCPPKRLLGPGDWVPADLPHQWTAQLTAAQAALLQARLRGLGLAGEALQVKVLPKLKREAVREGRLVEARLRRQSSPGFSQSGTRLDDEGKMSLTPEALAMAMAKPFAGQSVVDATCGAGGNAIAFARRGCDVVAIDTSASRLQLAEHNARTYGVAQRIRFVHGDAVREVANWSADLLFVDPPWGGAYDKVRTGCESLPLLRPLLDAAGSRFAAQLLKLPPSFDPAELPDFRVGPVFGASQGDTHRIKFLALYRAEG